MMMRVLAFLLGMLVAAPALAADDAMPPAKFFVLIYAPGPAWKAGLPMRQQGLGPHLGYMKQLRDTHVLFAAGAADREQWRAHPLEGRKPGRCARDHGARSGDQCRHLHGTGAKLGECLRGGPGAGSVPRGALTVLECVIHHGQAFATLPLRTPGHRVARVCAPK